MVRHFFILLTHEGLHREVYREFQPSYDIVRRWCQGLFRPQVPCTPSQPTLPKRENDDCSSAVATRGPILLILVLLAWSGPSSLEGWNFVHIIAEWGIINQSINQSSAAGLGCTMQYSKKVGQSLGSFNLLITLHQPRANKQYRMANQI